MVCCFGGIKVEIVPWTESSGDKNFDTRRSTWTFIRQCSVRILRSKVPFCRLQDSLVLVRPEVQMVINETKPVVRHIDSVGPMF